MGAIFGIVGDGSLREVQAMGAAVRHRGQHQQYWSPARGVYFGQAEHRPFEIDDSAMATDWHVAGEQSDLPDRFARTGPAALARLRGTFSLALCDGPASVCLAVDHMGFKSLYYAVLRDRFVFASEYKSLLALADVPLEPNRSAIQHYLATKSPLDRQAFLACVRSVRPGEALEYGAGHLLHASSYWKPNPAVIERTPEEHARVVGEALLSAVERQVSPYEQIGITLGAGIDAAIVLGAVRRVAPDVRVSSFTIGAGETDWEIVGARETASVFGTDHHEYVFDPLAIRTDLPRLVWLTEDCGGREEVILQMHVLAHAAAHTKAIFGGYSADRVFGGMPRHRLVDLADRLPVFGTPLRELFQLTQCGASPSSLAGRALQRALYGSTPPQALPVPGAETTPSVYWAPELNRYICGTVQGCPSYQHLEPFHEVGGATFHSPFLDPDLIAVSLTVPSWLKTGWRRQKRVLREATAGIVPSRIRNRRKAMQRLDVRGQMGEVLCALADEWLVDSAIQEHGLLTRAQLNRLALERTQVRERREVALRLWSVLSLECWARQFLTAQRGEPATAAPELMRIAHVPPRSKLSLS
jgi:asparagine synthase (glutamine-hydrolysing)